MRISDWSSDVCSSDLPQQVAHLQIRGACDEIERAVMGAPQPLTFQPLVGVARHVTVAEVQQLDSPSDFRLAQKQGGCRVKLVSHIDVYSDSGDRKSKRLNSSH